MKKEKIDLTHNELYELWNGLYFQGSSHTLNKETYKHIKQINTSDQSDGPSWDYILERNSDGKFFKFNVWDAGTRNGYIFEDKYLIEVFEKTEITYE